MLVTLPNTTASYTLAGLGSIQLTASLFRSANYNERRISKPKSEVKCILLQTRTASSLVMTLPCSFTRFQSSSASIMLRSCVLQTRYNLEKCFKRRWSPYMVIFGEQGLQVRGARRRLTLLCTCWLSGCSWQTSVSLMKS